MPQVVNNLSVMQKTCSISRSQKDLQKWIAGPTQHSSELPVVCTAKNPPCRKPGLDLEVDPGGGHGKSPGFSLPEESYGQRRLAGS